MAALMVFLTGFARWLAVYAGSFLFAFALIGPPPAIAADPPAQQTTEPRVLSSRTELVAVPVSVTDHQGNFVAGLTIRNFQIFDDGQPQTIEFFEQQDTPITVGLLIDHSGSMGPKLPAVAAAIADFARSSNPQDEMFFVDFSDTVFMQLFDGQSFTSDAAQLERAVTSVSARGRTALYDAVAQGIAHLRLGKWNKRALILVSDGGDNASHYNFAQVLQLARGSHAVIYAIGLVSESGQEENPDILRRLCRDTGGLAFFPGPRGSIAAISGEIARDLRSQYILAFVPPKRSGAGTFHKLTVKVTAHGHGKLSIRARAGYSEETTAAQTTAPSATSKPRSESDSP
jgi:Ca-activated chloride channel family protein